MKTPAKATAAAFLAAAILTAGPAAAMASEASASQPGTQAEYLDRAITLKPTGAALMDHPSGMTVADLGMLTPSYPMSAAPFPASAPIQTADGFMYRVISLDRCGLGPAAYFIADKAVATDQPRTKETDAAGQAARGSAAHAADFLSHITGTGFLLADTPVYDRPVDEEPLYTTAGTGVTLVPATEPFTAGNIEWRRIIAPGMTRAVVKSADVFSFTATTCEPNAALPFAPDGAVPLTPTPEEAIRSAAQDAAIHREMTAAASEAIEDRDAQRDAAAATVTGTEQGADSPAGTWMLAGGAVGVAALVGVLISRSTKTKVAK